jgi:hypothetical protein
MRMSQQELTRNGVGKGNSFLKSEEKCFDHAVGGDSACTCPSAAAFMM